MARVLDRQPAVCDPSVQLATAVLPGIFEGSGYGPSIARGVAAGVIRDGLPKLGPPWCFVVAGGLAMIALAPRRST